MATNQTDNRAKLVDVLIDKIDEDPYPSGTYMDLVEELLTPEDLSRYVDVLVSKIEGEQFPSVSMLQRLSTLVV